MVSMMGSIHVLWISVTLYLAAALFMLLLRVSDPAEQEPVPDRSAGES